MVFKRRDSRSWLRVVFEVFWPRGGWGRAVQYIQLRLRRLPGTPEQIARGIFAGVFVVFSPFYGLHFIFAAVIAKMMRGNILAALLATFAGNPLTYIPISIVSLRTGYAMLQTPREDRVRTDIFARFSDATADLWHNFRAMFTPAEAHWEGLIHFWNSVFYPWIIGGILPGLIFGIASYYLSVPVIRAYQKRRTARLRKKIEKQQAKAGGASAER